MIGFVVKQGASRRVGSLCSVAAGGRSLKGWIFSRQPWPLKQTQTHGRNYWTMDQNKTHYRGLLRTKKSQPWAKLLWLFKQENGNRKKRCSGSLHTTYEYWTTKSGGLIFIHSRTFSQVFWAFSDQSPPFQEVISQEKTQVAAVYLALLKRLAWMSLAFYQTSFPTLTEDQRMVLNFFFWVPHWLALLRVLHVAHRQEALNWCYLANQEK